MTLHRMDHVGVIVDDLEAAVAFFTVLGLEQIGSHSFGGDERVDRINGLQDVRSEMAMLDVPGGNGRLELIQHVNPPVRDPDPGAPPNTAGLRHLCFAVDDLDGTLERLRPHGASLLGEVVNYDDAYLLAYVRGPAGIILELAEAIPAPAA